MKPILGNMKLTQIAIVVKDVEAVKAKYAEFLGMEVPPTANSGKYEVVHTEYMGAPAPDAYAKLAFFVKDGMQYEIIEPTEVPSVWRDFLNARGEGLHHIGVEIDDIDEGCKVCDAFGMKLVQKGLYGDGSGAYAYYDAEETLGCIVELLCSFKK